MPWGASARRVRRTRRLGTVPQPFSGLWMTGSRVATGLLAWADDRQRATAGPAVSGAPGDPWAPCRGRGRDRILGRRVVRHRRVREARGDQGASPGPRRDRPTAGDGRAAGPA